MNVYAFIESRWDKNNHFGPLPWKISIHGLAVNVIIIRTIILGNWHEKVQFDTTSILGLEINMRI